MKIFAIQWDDGSVSICTAATEQEAIQLIDEIGPPVISKIVELKGPIFITLARDLKSLTWSIEAENIGEELESEIDDRFYPEYAKALVDGTEKQCRRALKKDMSNAFKTWNQKNP